MDLDQISLICKALGDTSRLNIVKLLTRGEKCGCEQVLSECGLVQVRKSAKWSYYSLNCEQWIAFRDSIDAFRCACVRNDEGRCCWP